MVIGVAAGHPLSSDGPITTSTLVHPDPHQVHARTWSRWYRRGMPVEAADADL
jgi:hypothetical protein